MHRKIATLTLVALAATAANAAEPYVGVGYQAGAARVERNSLRYPVIDGRTLDQSGHDSVSSVRVLAGIRFSDRWSLEAAFQQPTLEASFEQDIVGTDDDEEWESSIRSTHVSLAPVFQHRLSARAALRVSAGLLYGDYKLRRTHAIDVDNGPDEVLSRAGDSDSKLGAMAGVGFTLRTPWKVDALAEVLHQRTSVVSDSSVVLGLVYRF
jgi:opacity protein-like surface antigen